MRENRESFSWRHYTAAVVVGAALGLVVVLGDDIYGCFINKECLSESIFQTGIVFKRIVTIFIYNK